MNLRTFKAIIYISVILTIGLISLAIYYRNCESIINIIEILLSIVSTITTIIAFLYAFKPKPKLKGKVNCRNTGKSEFPVIGDTSVEHKNITFKIQNTSGMSLSNLQVSLRIPSQLVHPYKVYSNYGLKTRIIKETYIYTLIEPTFLGSSYGDDSYLIEQFLCLQKWEKGNIYITISANEIQTSTFKFDKTDKIKLITSKKIDLQPS